MALVFARLENTLTKFGWKSDFGSRTRLPPLHPAVSDSDSISLQSSAAAKAPSTAPSEQHRWFSDHVQPHGSALKAYVRSAYPMVRDADDVVQETYLRIWRARALHPIESAKAFLFKIARNIALDSLRRGRASPIDVVPDLADLHVIDTGADGAQTACRNEEIAMLAQALEALPPRSREIVLLRKFQNLPQREVAERLGISELTVQEQVYRGVRRMEKFLIKRGLIRPWHS